MKRIFQHLISWLLLSVGAATSAPAADKAGPQLSISLRGPVNQTVEQGEPWRVAVRLDLPRGTKETVRLAPASGPWTETVSIELLPASGGAAVARAETVGAAGTNEATLDATHIAGGLWRFSPVALQAVAPGKYVVRAKLSIASGSGWTGVVQARDFPLQVVAPVVPTPVRRLVNEAHDRMLTGQLQDAAREIDVVLRKTPRDPALLIVRAQIAEQAGNPFAATVCLNAANFTPPGKKIRGQPAAEEMEMQARLDRARRAMTASTAKPPEWTWPPTEVVTAFAAEAQKAGITPSTPPEKGVAPTASTPAPLAAAATTPAPSGSPIVPAAATPPKSDEKPMGVVVPVAELDDAKILTDPNGQWAAAAAAGSQYSSPTYAALQATGVPNVPVAGDSPLAWCPARQSGGTEWIELTFARPVRATEVRVRQTNLPGTIGRIEVIDSSGRSQLWWQGEDPRKPATNEVAWFAVRIPEKTDFPVAKVKITLNLDARPGWKQLDAVQLVGTAP